MLNRSLLAATLSLALLGGAAPASRAQPSEVAYQGELKENGARFTGVAQMKFAIVSGCPSACLSLWSNDGKSVAGSQPSSAIDVSVINGVFSVYLGQSPMDPLSPASLASASSVSLRVWVKTTGDFEELSDQRIASVPFALRSEGNGTADVWTTSGSNVFRIVGNVGIGTDHPASQLEVSVANHLREETDGITVFNHNNASNGYGGSITFGVTASAPGSFLAARISAENFDNTSTDGGKLTFWTAARDASHTLTERMLVNALGNVGIGTANPLVPLHISSGKSGWGNPRLLIENTATVGADDDQVALGLKHGGAYDWELGCISNGHLTLRDVTSGTDKLVVTPGASGTVAVSVLEITGGSDLAELFNITPTASEAQPTAGMVVVLDPVRPGELQLARQPYDPKVAGVISGANGLAAGLIMKSAGRREVSGARAVALSGRVWCWVDASWGPVHPGDLLTTSSTPGMAMVARDASQRQGAVLGKAMSSLEHGRGLVLALVSLQ